MSVRLVAREKSNFIPSVALTETLTPRKKADSPISSLPRSDQYADITDDEFSEIVLENNVVESARYF